MTEAVKHENGVADVVYLVLHNLVPDDFEMYIVRNPLPETKAALDTLHGIVINSSENLTEVQNAAYEIIFGESEDDGDTVKGKSKHWAKATFEEVHLCMPNFICIATFLL